MRARAPPAPRGPQPPRAVRAPARAPPPRASAASLWAGLDDVAAARAKAPPSEKLAYAEDVKAALAALKDAGATPKFGLAKADGSLVRRNIMLGELRQVGIKNPEKVAVPSVRNDAAFLVTTVLGSSAAAVLVGQLPGDWGGFGAYLVGGIPIVVLAVGSTAPQLLTWATDKFQRVFPDYRERVRRHEAAHFLVSYLLGLPVAGYSLDIGAAHTDVAEAEESKRLIEGFLDDAALNTYAVAAMAGVAGEGRWSDEVVGQTADLFDLQKVLNRARPPLPPSAQQNATRWAVWTAAKLLRDHDAEYSSLRDAMGRGASLADCVRAIEETAAAPAAR